jgi:Domain of unknown function (DUF4340)
MNPKNTCILVFVAGALFAFIFFFERHLHKPVPGPIKVMGDFKPESVTGLQILLPGQRIALERTNDIWRITDPHSYPAQSQAVDYLVRAAAELMPQTRISAEELRGRLNANEEFGFRNPQATIIFEQGGSDAVTLKLGSLTTPGDQIYAQVVGVPNVDIIDADFFKKLVPRQANDWRDTSFVALTNVSFDHLTVTSGSQWFELRRDNTNDLWHMTNPVQTRADNVRLLLLLSALQNLRITRFVSDEPKVDLEPFGLQPAALELKFDQGTNHVLALQFGKSPTNDEGQIYARVGGQSSIVLVPRERVLPWAAGFQEFRDRHLVRFADGPPDIIEAVGIAKDDNFDAQRQPDNSWRVIKPLELPADPDIMHSFLTNLAGLEVLRINNLVAVDDGALPDDSRYGLAKPIRRYILKRTAKDSPAVATNEVIAELDFGSAKDGHIFVRRADRPEESSVYAVKLDDFEKLPATALQLRTRRIWDFSETNVSSITISRNGKNEKLLHQDTNQWAIAPGSQGIFNNAFEVEVAVQELGFLAAENWIQRGDQDRARFGFTDKSLQISVEVKDNDKPRTLTVDLGGVAPNGLRYGEALMEDGQKWIFEFPSKSLDLILTFLNIRENAGP